jgi:hypothetical protein
MSERRTDNLRRELPDKRKSVLPVVHDKRSGVERHSSKDRRVAKDRRVFWDKRSPRPRRRVKDQRNIDISEIPDQTISYVRRSGYRQTVSVPVTPIKRAPKTRRVVADRRVNKRRQKSK